MNVDFGIRAIYGVNYHGGYITGDGAALEPRAIEQVGTSLWWRPVAALKFGLEYEYSQAKYLANLGEPNAAGVYINPSDRGTEHRVEFVGFFYF